ncbi:MAG: tRNA1(Val) (adenine(37)-N6)-methyltransferase [Nitrospirota bacterium]|jgi:tRNA1Val (adenine37-N6)-methyltransferase|nr:tRNA1(Val) (adenine(37)-N6)-methyltransferase [Nitrospirota bacterium]
MELTLDTIRDIKLYQNKKGYRFSVDALLLYSFVNLRRAYRIADLGAGSGIVGILLAKKYHDSEVALIEIQNSLAGLAEKNIVLNKVEKRVRVIRTDIKKFKLGDFHSENKTTLNSPLLTPNSFDLVVSNPPFRRQKTGLISPTDEKAIARHEIELKLADLIQAACSLLRSKGRFCMIYHPSRLVELIDALREKHMEPKRLRFVHSTLRTEAKMVLVEAIKDGKAEMKIEKPFCIYKEDGTYTDEIKALY